MRHLDGGWVAVSHVLEERADGRQASVARPDAVAALGLEMVKEREDGFTINLFDAQAAGRLARSPRDEDKQKAEGVTVAADGCRACGLLRREPAAEEGL